LRARNRLHRLNREFQRAYGPAATDAKREARALLDDGRFDAGCVARRSSMAAT
jgi:hypothetical protein